MVKLLNAKNTRNVSSKGVNSFLIIIILFIGIGFILGLNSVFYMSTNNLEELNSYLSGFMRYIGQQSINYKEIFLNSVISNLILFLIIYVLGKWFFGGPFILVAILFKGYTIGFTFTTFIRVLGTKGLGIALAGVVPQNLFYIPCFIFIGMVALRNSYEQLKRKFTKENKIKYDNSYINATLMVAIPLVIGIIIESFLMPSILKAIVSKLY
ncbi:stage II sporulation protein M [Inconstantimicrobium mannanitabidum]|uniref:Stage II sporulation protein M n=1 Tax=Inconstantimicrobium mannanitabidum TaxID=1604901 RepID=A0ACB5RAG0_9CLOT|nr:stage II sporulation protein M [Clostridium sp. TW13]GKX66173.1 stage II sporulation protein M [Clostridium sp. TW13]